MPHAERALAMSTQDPVGAERRERARRIASDGRGHHTGGGGQHVLAHGGQGDGVRGAVEADQLDAVGLLDHLTGSRGVPGEDGLGEAVDLLVGAEVRAQPGDVAAGLRHQRAGLFDVCQDRPGLDRAQLVRIAQQDQARLGGQCRHQVPHQLQRHHGGLVDHHHVVRQWGARPVLQMHGAGPRPEKFVQCAAPEAQAAREPLRDGRLQPGRRLARGGGQGHPRV